MNKFKKLFLCASIMIFSASMIYSETIEIDTSKIIQLKPGEILTSLTNEQKESVNDLSIVNNALKNNNILVVYPGLLLNSSSIQGMSPSDNGSVTLQPFSQKYDFMDSNNSMTFLSYSSTRSVTINWTGSLGSKGSITKQFEDDKKILITNTKMR